MRRSTRRSSLKSGTPVLTGSSVLSETWSPAKPSALSKSSTGKGRKKQQTASPLLPASEAVGKVQTIAERLEPKALEGRQDEPRTKTADKEADLTSKKKSTNTKNAVILRDQGDEDSNDAGSDDACTRTASSEDGERQEDGTAECLGAAATALVTPRPPSSAPSRRRRGLRPAVS
jgi:hypothetical protein